MKKYFVSYTHKMNGAWGVGNGYIEEKDENVTQESIDRWHRTLQTRLSKNELVITNFIEIKGE
jgi:hypothetical protein